VSHYWNNNPELWDEIIVKEMRARGLATEDEEIEVIIERWGNADYMVEVASAAEADHFGSIADAVNARMRV
jgi:hypothetical protein